MIHLTVACHSGEHAQCTKLGICDCKCHRIGPLEEETKKKAREGKAKLRDNPRNYPDRCEYSEDGDHVIDYKTVRYHGCDNRIICNCTECGKEAHVCWFPDTADVEW